jgi:hypothetical protein
MPNVTATNTSSKPISVLGMGPVQPNTVKSAYIEEAQFFPHARAYRERSANIGLVIQELGMPVPTGVEEFTGAGTIADATKIALVTAADPYALVLPAAADVDADSPLNLRYTSGDSDVFLTPASGDTAGDAAVTYDLAATAADPAPGFAITLTTTITRTDGGSWLTEGYLAGGRIVIQDAEDVGNNGTFLIATVAESVITTTGLTNNAADTVVHFGVDNRLVLDADNDIIRLVSDGVSAWTLA